MTTIKLSANDQVLSIVTQPKIASGDINSVLLQVDFDDGWDGYIRTAVFYTSLDETVYKADLTDDQCIVPYEVLAEPGTLFIGVRGVKSDNTVKTTILVKYKIELGAPNGVKEPGDIPPGGGGGGGDDGGTIDPKRIPDMYYTDWIDFLPETELTFIDSGEGVYIAPITFAEDLSTYPTYKVTYNGEVYTTSYNEEMNCIGNMALLGMEEDTGEPFLITSMGALSPTEQPPATIKIQLEGVKPISAQYLPEPELFDFIEAGIENVSPSATGPETISVPGIWEFAKRAYKRGICRVRFNYMHYSGNGSAFAQTTITETVNVSFDGSSYLFQFERPSTFLEFEIKADDTVSVKANYYTRGMVVTPP